MSDSFIKIKYEKLIFELKFLEADLNYHNSILQKGSSEFDAQCRATIKSRGLEKVFYGEKSPAEKHASNQAEEKKKAKKPRPDQDVEQLFRKIANITHPDKLVHLPDNEKETKEEMFMAAKEAKDDNNLFRLHVIAADLKIEIPEVTLENLLLFESKITEIKSEIESKKSTWMWNWLISPPEKRTTLISDYVDFMIQTIVTKNSTTTE
tara:strand:- start:1826 stop:2449 length:624 start_codon:yes stop_codon:yes gene_type:complete